jgi:hypothetical protein
MCFALQIKTRARTLVVSFLSKENSVAQELQELQQQQKSRLDVDLLNLQVVQDVGHRLKSKELSSANILLTLCKIHFNDEKDLKLRQR